MRTNPHGKGIVKGDIFWVNLSDEAIGSEQRGFRPVVIIQNDIGNKYSPTVLVAPLTNQKKKELPIHCYVSVRGVRQTVCLEQIRVLDKSRLRGKVGQLTPTEMKRVNEAIRVSFAV